MKILTAYGRNCPAVRRLLGACGWLLLATGLLAQEAPPPSGGEKDPVILLPKEVVRAKPDRLPEPRDLYDPKAFRDSLVKRYPGLSFRGQPESMDNYAVLQERDERRLASMESLRKLSSTLRASGDTAGSDDLDREIERTFVRRPTWREDAMDRNINRCR